MGGGSEAPDDEQVVAGPTDTTEASSPDPPPQVPKGYRDLFVNRMTTARAAKPLCPKYQVILSNWSALAQGRLASSRGADTDSYTAADFRSRVSWVPKEHQEAFVNAIYRTSRVRLRAVTRPGLTSEMIERFTRDALSSCKLRADYDQTSSALVSLDSRLRSVDALAETVPWYPRDYYEWGDNLAWQWVENPACDYFSCWQIRVRTLDGCPSGLYAEINIKSGGTVTDYSNDALGSLGAGETALLTFTDTSDSSDTATLTEINCY
jgi:hypothetical protein